MADPARLAGGFLRLSGGSGRWPLPGSAPVPANLAASIDHRLLNQARQEQVPLDAVLIRSSRSAKLGTSLRRCPSGLAPGSEVSSEERWRAPGQPPARGAECSACGRPPLAGGAISPWAFEREVPPLTVGLRRSCGSDPGISGAETTQRSFSSRQAGQPDSAAATARASFWSAAARANQAQPRTSGGIGADSLSSSASQSGSSARTESRTLHSSGGRV